MSGKTTARQKSRFDISFVVEGEELKSDALYMRIIKVLEHEIETEGLEIRIKDISIITERINDS